MSATRPPQSSLSAPPVNVPATPVAVADAPAAGPSGAKLRRESVREAFFNAARALFAEAGFGGVTLRRVGERCGYSAAAIYRHFEDKTALLFELCAQDWVRLAAALADARAAAGTPALALPAVLDAYVAWALANRHSYHLLMMMGLPADAERAIDLRWGERFPEDPVNAVLMACVHDQQATALIDSMYDPGDVANALWTAVHGLAALDITFEHLPHEDWQPLAHRQQVLLAALLRGFSRPSR
ncbi:TetR/AcrR family transcriptional regulator [Cupriavidus sp. YAF13]|uniref:TetR/AcrR family transcriptional regulator n=1 Tax=Cupriavidus sp. YAF13 TaxID=3233075 RepID=UPI003F9113E2